MMTSRSFFVDESFQSEINQLRMQEYANASGFAVDLTTLQWKQSDSDSFVLAAQAADGTLVATMRGEVINDPELLAKKLECEWEFPLELKFPVLLLSRAATLTTQRTSGLNLALRYWFLKFAEEHGIPFVVGTFVAESPREKTLREMGYQFFENKVGWLQSTYRSLRPVCVVALDMERDGARAIQYGAERVGNTILEFSLKEAFPPLRFVQGL